MAKRCISEGNTLFNERQKVRTQCVSDAVEKLSVRVMTPVGVKLLIACLIGSNLKI